MYPGYRPLRRPGLRTKLFREIVANLIVHREYPIMPTPAVIYKDRVLAENANNTHGEGPMDPFQFAPFPKNPSLVKFFVQRGRADELGSGVLNVSRRGAIYSGRDVPEFSEELIVRMIISIPISCAAPDGGLNEELKSVLVLIQQRPGIQAKDRASQLDRPIKTGKRQLKTRVDQYPVERSGSRKTGGYHPTFQ